MVFLIITTYNRGIGILTYHALTGKYPFDTTAVCELLQSIREVKYTLPDNLSEMSKKYIRSILQKNIDARPDVKNLICALTTEIEHNVVLKTAQMTYFVDDLAETVERMKDDESSSLSSDDIDVSYDSSDLFSSSDSE